MDDLWTNFPGCKCLKHFLLACGFDSKFSLCSIDNNALNMIEAHINENREIIQKIDCSHKQMYERITRFTLLPGHRLTLSNLPEFFKSKSYDTELKKNHPAFSSVLSTMVTTALDNYNKPPNTHRYPKLVTDFAMYTYLSSGKASYKMLCRNLPLPKEPTILSHMHIDKNVVIEGDLRCDDLRQHFIKNKSDPESEMFVFLSEDGSGIVKRPTYDSKTQQLVGIVLPLKENGMPKTMCFTPRSAEEIENFMKLEQSALVYIVVAQPLTPNIPPFILQIFGTNNKFKKGDVLARWAHIEKETKRFGINVIGVSSDGDPRLLSSMRSKVQLSLKNFSKEELENYVAQGSEWIFAQDTVHIGTKLRNRLLKSDLLLPMGNCLISISHLKILLKNVPKNIHLLVRSDICPLDRQNYSSLEKMMSNNVIDALEKNVIGSEATVMFLHLCKQITASYLDEKMEPLERIYNIWQSLYFIRAWRKWISSSANSYRLDNNFITNNAYQCIEINAHALIFAILKLRNSNKAHLFQPNLFSSQACEQIFRRMRSLGTQNFTKINFSLFELLHMVSRVELMNSISSENDDKIFFPQSKSQTITFELPNDDDILETISRAKRVALQNAKKFGMIFSASDIDSTELKQIYKTENATEVHDDDLAVDEDSDEDNDSENDSRTRDNDSNSKYVHVELDGSIEEIRKSRLVWLLSESKEKLSSDRLKRVQGAPQEQKCKRQKLDHFENSTQIEIGEWCAFKKNGLRNRNSANPFENVVFGAITGFKYSEEKSSQENKKQKYIFDFATLTDHKLLVLASWQECNNSGVLSAVEPESAFFIPIINFIDTTGTPKIEINPQTNLQVISFQKSIKEIEKKLLKCHFA